jgi:hypothetical protein
MPIRCYATSEHKGCQGPIGHETSGDETGHSACEIEARRPGAKKTSSAKQTSDGQYVIMVNCTVLLKAIHKVQSARRLNLDYPT